MEQGTWMVRSRRKGSRLGAEGGSGAGVALGWKTIE
jgi:hypothetical protein